MEERVSVAMMLMLETLRSEGSCQEKIELLLDAVGLQQGGKALKA